MTQINRLYVALVNPDMLRLTVSTTIPFRHVAHMNEAGLRVEAETNNHPDHAKYGPWKVANTCEG